MHGVQVVVFLSLIVGALWLVWRSRQGAATPVAANASHIKTGGANPALSRPETEFTTVASGRPRTVISEWREDWKFKKKNRGAFSFKARKPGGGLIVGLGYTPDENFEYGYAIVLDDGVDRGHESWMSKLPFIGAKFPGSKQTTGIPLAEGQTYWVSFNRGFIAIGFGETVGAQVLLTGLDASVRAGLTVDYFGFGSYGIGSADGYVYDIKIIDLPDRDIPQAHTELVTVEYLSGRASRTHPKPFALTEPGPGAAKFASTV